ncbi:MAG: hypothetical protein PHZ26_02005 [Candidatus Gracilibacteria bacterium]|nr:hypothetical protein [Candidatus Gracilibacteria bacterium]
MENKKTQEESLNEGNDGASEGIRKKIKGLAKSLEDAMYKLLNDDQLKGSGDRIKKVEPPKQRSGDEIKKFEDNFN